MRLFWIFISALALVACDTPSRAFKGVEATRMTVGGSTFDVRIKERRAEAIRLNSEYAPRLSGIAPKAMFAIEKVSGCEVRKLGGDAAMVVASLKCKGDAEAAALPRNVAYECDIDEAYLSRFERSVVTEMSCHRVRP